MGKKDSSTEMEKIGKLIYKDLGHPALSQVGNAVGSLIRLVALPITFLGLTAEELEKKYAKFIQKTLEKVPEKKRIDPKAVVAAPLLDHVKFVFDEENLSEMFSNLLANAMMENVEAMVHPAFAEMLKQLSPLDAEFMFLYFKDEDIVEQEDIKWKYGEGQLSLTIESLLRLGIINGITYDNRDDVAYALTDFGKLFRDLCLMTPTDIEQDEFVFQDEQNGQHIHQGADLLLLGLAGDDIQQGPGDDTDGDALRDAVCSGHCQDGQECGDALSRIVELDLQGRTHHVEANDDQGRSGRKAGDGQEQGAEHHGQQEQHTGGHGGQAGAAALGHAGSALDEGGGGGGAQYGTGAGGDGVGHQRTLDVGQLALLIQHVGLGSNTDQGAQGIKQVNEEEGEHHGEEVQDANAGEIGLEHLTKGLAQSREIEADEAGGDDAVHAGIGVGDVDAGQLAEDAQHPGDEDAVQDAALDLFDQQDGGDEHAHQREDRTHADAVEGLALEVLIGNKGGIAVHDQLCVLQADESNEQTDAHADSALQGHGDGVEDGLTHIGQAQHDEDDALHKNGHQGQLPAVTHGQDDRVGEVGVQAHAGCQCKRIVGKQSHKRSANKGCQRGGDQHSLGIHARCGQDVGVDGKDVSHGHEGSDTGHDLGLYISVVFFQVKELF